MGNLLLHVGRYQSAEQALRDLLSTVPSSGRLLGYLGDALWLQGRGREARACYARALLLDSSSLSLREIRDQEFVELVEEEGVEQAPVQGWLQGMIPLVNIEEDLLRMEEEQGTPEQFRSLRAYAALLRAENARLGGRHEEMVSCRQRLKVAAPDIFHAYMEHLRGLLL